MVTELDGVIAEIENLATGGCDDAYTAKELAKLKGWSPTRTHRFLHDADEAGRLEVVKKPVVILGTPWAVK